MERSHLNAISTDATSISHQRCGGQLASRPLLRSGRLHTGPMGDERICSVGSVLHQMESRLSFRSMGNMSSN